MAKMRSSKRPDSPGRRKPARGKNSRVRGRIVKVYSLVRSMSTTHSRDKGVKRAASSLAMFPTLRRGLPLLRKASSIHLSPGSSRSATKAHTPKRRLAEIKVAARARAEELRQLPREEVGQNLLRVVEEIRQGVVARGMGIEGEWCDE